MRRRLLLVLLLAARPVRAEPDLLRVGVGWGAIAVIGTDIRGALLVVGSYALWRTDWLALRASLSLSSQEFGGDGALFIFTQHADVELAPVTWFSIYAGVGHSQQVGGDRFGVHAGLVTQPTLCVGLRFSSSGSPRYGVSLEISHAVFQQLVFETGGMFATVAW